MRRYTLDTKLADEYMDFMINKIIPAREGRGFVVDSIWISDEKDQLIWFVSYPGGPEDYAAADKSWVESEERAQMFQGRPEYIIAKDLREVTKVR